MKSFSHANNIVLRRGIYIHTLCSLPSVKLIKLFSLANGTWCAVTVPALYFVKDDCAVGRVVVDKKVYKLRCTQAMVLFLVKATPKRFSELTESAAMGFLMVYAALQAVHTTTEKEFRTIVFLWLVLTQNSFHTLQKVKQHDIKSNSL